MFNYAIKLRDGTELFYQLRTVDVEGGTVVGIDDQEVVVIVVPIEALSVWRKY